MHSLGLPITHTSRINICGIGKFIRIYRRRLSVYTSPSDPSVWSVLLREIASSSLVETCLVFSMFDFDEDGRLERNDFKELCSFFMGLNVPARVHGKLWHQLDSNMDGYVSQEDYIRWVDGNNTDHQNVRKLPLRPDRIRPITRSKASVRVRTLFDAYIFLKDTRN